MAVSEMSDPNQIQTIAREAIESQLNSLTPLTHQIDESFAGAAEALLKSSGRLIVTGIGKSAIVGQKITATLNSTGQPAVFMHAADAIHGDLGMVQPNDCVLAISKSGNTPEIQALLPLLKMRGNPLIALVGNTDSPLSHGADFVLNATVDREACPHNLAPTTSTSAQMLMGDALAITLLRMRGFSAADFAGHHPGGQLGKRLYLTCGDIAAKHGQPSVQLSTAWRDVVLEMTKHRLGMTAVLDQDQIAGIITDGDLRRMLEKHSDLEAIVAADIQSPNPSCIESDTLALEAAALMQERKITQLIVKQNGVYAGVVHLHDLYQEGIL
jgi:arabinose-5-phosphate isomerase